MHRATVFRQLLRLGFVFRSSLCLTPEQAAQADAWNAENRATLTKSPAPNDRDGE